MAACAAEPALFFTFAAMVLLIFATISSPVWHDVSFLKANGPGGAITFGVFGYNGSGVHVGYHFPASLIGYQDNTLNNATFHNLTFTLVLVPVAAALSGLAFFFGLLGAAYHRVGTIIMSLLAALATLVTLVAWVLAMILFGIARNHLRKHGFTAQYHNAMWFLLGALVSLFLAFCTGAIGSFGSYRRRRNERVSTY